MGCCASSDTDDDRSQQGQRSPHPHNGARVRAAARARAGNVAAAASSSDDEDTREARRQQEAEDHALAEMLQHEQFMFIERHNRLEQQRAAAPPHSPNLPGLNEADFETVGRVMKFTMVHTTIAKKKSFTSPASPLMPKPLARVGSGSSHADSDVNGGDATFPLGADRGHLRASGGSCDDVASVASGVMATEPVECTLCMEDLSTGCELRALYCGHVFHRACIDDWLRRRRLCPMCQQDVTVMVGTPSKMNLQGAMVHCSRTHRGTSLAFASPAPAVADEVVEGQIVDEAPANTGTEQPPTADDPGATHDSPLRGRGSGSSPQDRHYAPHNWRRCSR
jgi:hypothetical protein